MTLNGSSSYTAKRWLSFNNSIFSEMTTLAKQYEAANLGQGFPDFHGPKKLLDAISYQVQNCHNQYAPSAGELNLRENVSVFVEAQIGVKYSPIHEITITNGATEAIFCTISAFINPGDKILVFEPAFDLYYQAIANAGGVVVPIKLHAPDTPLGMHNFGWNIDWSEFDAASAAGFKMIILNSPHNPTGKVFSEEEIDRIAIHALKNKAIVISDEVYENFIYNNVHYISPASIPKIQHLVVRISSAAKTFGFTGLKVGWACAPFYLTEAIRIVHQATVFSLSPFTQLGIANVLADTNWLNEYLEEQRLLYFKKKEQLKSILTRAGYYVCDSEGTFFLMANYEALAGDQLDISYAKELVEIKRVATIPLSIFYQTPPKSLAWLRFAFCKSEQLLNRVSSLLLS